MIKPRTHMLDVAAESSIDGLLIHTVAWLENTCNSSYNGFLKRQHLHTKFKIILPNSSSQVPAQFTTVSDKVFFFFYLFIFFIYENFNAKDA